MERLSMNKVATEKSILGNKAWFRVKDLSEILSIGQSTIWKMVKLGTFPKPKSITPRLTIWMRQDIEQWVENKQKEVA